uniref:Uncharacterized protein n=1 Tax=Chenopodium quinoa TaxID=63459 RepID=A0A803LP36_CHEQI
MESYIRILYIALLSLILLTSSSEGRKDPQTYWGDMMKGQPMPEALKDFINQKSYEGHEKKDTIITDCNDLVHHDKLASKKLFDDEFEPIPNVSAYNE